MTSIQGILSTRNYKQFQILSPDDGKTILHESPALEGCGNVSLLAKGCLPGDTVEWTGSRYSLVERTSHPMLVGTLELASRTTYGMTSRGSFIFLFVPYNKSYPPFLVGSSEKDRSTHRLAVIQVDAWDTATSQFPRGLLEHMLGPVGDLKSEEEALLWHACPWPSLRNKHVIPPNHPIPAIEADARRRRLTGYTFNIDPPGCRDIDDVITLEHIAGTQRWNVTITIADVAAFVDEMGALDILASTFGQTLYKDGEAVRPMLPPTLSEGTCSLLAGAERRGVSMTFVWDRAGQTRGEVQWFESIFTNDASYTYEQFQVETRPSREVLREVAGGSDDSHKWVEAMMLLYNTEAAKLLRSTRTGILRRHTAPDAERLARYVSWDPSLSRIAMSSATYCLADETDVAHFGIGTEVYCHASSPIRRYADLMNQRILKQIIRGTTEGLMVSVPVEDLVVREKAAKQYEKKLVFIRELLGGPRTVVGRILEIVPEKQKIRVWVETWKTIVSVRGGADCASFAEGEEVQLECAINLLSRRWSEKLIVRVSKCASTDCQEAQCPAPADS